MVLNVLKEIFTGPTRFSLMDIPGFPYDAYDEQWTAYTASERWFTGQALDDQPESKAKVDLYPLRANPIVGTVLKHAYILFGEVEDDARGLVVPKVLYDPKKEGSKEQAQIAEDALNTLWFENHGRAILVESAIMSQIYGGCVLKATYVPWEWDEYGGNRTIPIRVETINPKNFIGVPDASDNYNLVEAWVVKEIERAAAIEWGYNGEDETVWYVEHWLNDTYSVTIDGKPAWRTVNGVPEYFSGANPFGFVPFVYIPHIRIGGFKGFNAFDHLTGLVKELNARWGDMGDAVNDDSHPVIAGKNIPGSVQFKRASDWLEYVDLGSNPGISGNEPEPDLWQVNSQRASPAMASMLKEIMAQYRRDAFVPPVADGEDEGSQRSGMTLAIRFWPLTSHAGTERYFWTPGLNVFHKMMLRIMANKQLGEITPEHLKLRIKEKWAPFLPRDREAEVQEWAIRANNNIASLEHLVELASDVEDIENERQKILAWVEDLEAAKLRAAQRHEMELQEATAEADLEKTEVQGKNQIEAADVQAKAFASRPQQPVAKKPGGQK
jgi:hypothetical protein